jgi:hypothetical protein
VLFFEVDATPRIGREALWQAAGKKASRVLVVLMDYPPEPVT